VTHISDANAGQPLRIEVNYPEPVIIRFGQRQSPIEICVTVLWGAWCYLLCAYRGVEYLEDAIVPMCQSPKIADVFLKAGQAPANDNCTSINAPRNSPSIYNAFPATLLTVSVFACFTAFFFF
jgi:hypothetical protein